MLCLYLQAHFGVFRTFMAGSFRPTAGFITPSAAYGLLLNVASLEMRHDDHTSPMTLIKDNLSPVKIALGALELPCKHSIFQQLHNYPIGNTGKEHAINTKGNKYNIIPVRRDFLSGIKAYIVLDGNPGLETLVQEGLMGKKFRNYGLPFLGDNNFLIDRLEPVEILRPAFWFEGIDEEQEGLRENITRLTITIDRADMAKTRSMLFAPTPDRQIDPPIKAWVEVNYS
jgi:CRISPR-associated protein Cas5t